MTIIALATAFYLIIAATLAISFGLIDGATSKGSNMIKNMVSGLMWLPGLFIIAFRKIMGK